MWRRREILRFKNETNLQPQIPKQIYKSNAEKGSQHNISVQKKLILWDSLTKTLCFRLLKDTSKATKQKETHQLRKWLRGEG